MNYKLIKEHPGSPPLGYITKPHKSLSKDGYPNHYYAGYWFEPLRFPEFWEKVEEPLFVTKDGVELFNPISKVYAVLGDSSIVTYAVSIIVNENLKSTFKDVIFFSTKERAYKYVERNIKRWSDEDMKSFAGYARGANDSDSTSEVFEWWKKSSYNTKK